MIVAPVPDHPLLAGSREIGRGENTIVLEGDVVNGQAHVFKVLSSPIDYAYYTAIDRPTGKHFPVVYADHGTAGRSSSGFPFHIVEVEKLYPLARDMGRIALHHLVVTPMGWAQTVQQSLQALEKFSVEYDALPDLLKADNLMIRQDGTLVFPDPIFMG